METAIVVHHGLVWLNLLHLSHSMTEGIPDATPALPVTGCGLSKLEAWNGILTKTRIESCWIMLNMLNRHVTNIYIYTHTHWSNNPATDTLPRRSGQLQGSLLTEASKISRPQTKYWATQLICSELNVCAGIVLGPGQAAVPPSPVDRSREVKIWRNFAVLWRARLRRHVYLILWARHHGYQHL